MKGATPAVVPVRLDAGWKGEGVGVGVGVGALDTNKRHGLVCARACVLESGFAPHRTTPHHTAPHRTTPHHTTPTPHHKALDRKVPNSEPEPGVVRYLEGVAGAYPSDGRSRVRGNRVPEGAVHWVPLQAMKSPPNMHMDLSTSASTIHMYIYMHRPQKSAGERGKTPTS